MREDCFRMLPCSEDPADRLAEFAYTSPSWTLSEFIEANEANGISEEHVYTNKLTGAVVRYVADDVVDFPYFVVHGPDYLAAAAELAQVLPVQTADDVVAAWDQARTWEDQVEAVLRLGIAAPPRAVGRGEFASRLAAALRHERSEVRDATVVALGYRKWNELRADVLALVEGETNEIVLKRAQLLLSRWDED